MAFDNIRMPENGEKISMGEDGRLRVPANPIVFFIRGDTDSDVWTAMQQIIFAAVDKAYNGKRDIVWVEASASDKASEDITQDNAGLLSEQTVEALREYLVTIHGPASMPAGGESSSLSQLLRQKLELYCCQHPLKGSEYATKIAIPCANINFLSGHAVFAPTDNIMPGKSNEQMLTPCAVVLCGEMMLRYLGWTEAANLILQAICGITDSKTLTCDFHRLLNDTARLSTADFSNAMMSYMDADSENNEAEVQYDQLAARFKELFDAGAEKSSEFAQIAMEKAREQLTSAGTFSEEQGKNLKSFLERDFARMADEVRKEARLKLNPTRVSVGALSSLSSLLAVAGGALASAAQRTEKAISCRSGEITSAGTLTCLACEHEMHFKKTGRVPPCPTCHATEFRKSY